MKTSQAKTTSENKAKTKEKTFPIVAIGASAGGLEAVMELLKHLPPDTGMAYIYVQHLSADHKSKLTEILSKKTKMKVQEIDDMDEIKPDNVYVIPSDKGIEVTGGRINLIPRSKSSTAVSVDILFTSLARAHKERVIGIVLSGSANDGTAGTEAIKEEGGLTFAQDDTAKFGSMPKSAIAAGAVDFVLAPKEIALELKRLSEHPFVKAEMISDKSIKDPDVQRDNPELKNIFNRLHEVTDVDFSSYKLKTIIRRIFRRMLLHQIATLKEYSKLLSQDKEEVNILYQDLLINVTRFFRDTDAHEYLKDKLFPKLLKEKKDGEPLRIWVPACATGEEAYSIAMTLLEIQKTGKADGPVQIFATDLSKSAIEKARIGVYAKKDLETVSPARIQRFFTKADGNYRVNKAVRSMCVFAPHNILRDPPFSRLDFISCCNLFIYFDTAAQKKAVGIFHYALNSNGYLMLGKSESISHSTNLFSDFNKAYKVYAPKQNSSGQRLPDLAPYILKHRFPEQKPEKAENAAPTGNITAGRKGLEKAIDDLLISEFMPAAVVINQRMEIVQFRGTTDPYLTHPGGKATFNILKMARPEIAFELRTVISKVIKTGERFRKDGIDVRMNSAVKTVAIEVVPFQIEGDEPLLMLLFIEQEQVKIASAKGKSENDDSSIKDRRIKKLEEELAMAKADALAASQEQEVYTEELQSAHEEVVSTNEELQTVNEELETSKEELESANEELIVSVQELQTRNDLLNESYEYSEAVVNTMHDPMLVLGSDLRVKSANKAFYRMFETTEEQTEEKLLYDLGDKQWDIPALRELLEDIIPKNSHINNFEVKHTFLHLGEKIMSLNASRIVQKTHREHLILLIISDITQVRQLLVDKGLREKELLNKELRERKKDKVRLEKAVEERTVQLKDANEALKSKNNTLATLNKELEAFAYVASHDLQEPLRMITSYMELLKRKYGEQLDDKAHTYIGFAAEGANKMKHLILDLLEYSKAGKSTEQLEFVDTKSILSDYLQLRRKVIAEKEASIEFGDLPDVKTHEAAMVQVFHGLLDNAIKYSKKGVPPEVKIAAEEKEKEWEFAVSDNGIGIDPEFFDKIFIIFQRLHNENQPNGSGIGLSAAKRHVESLGGRIWLESAPGEGSTFYFTVPKTLG